MGVFISAGLWVVPVGVVREGVVPYIGVVVPENRTPSPNPQDQPRARAGWYTGLQRAELGGVLGQKRQGLILEV